MNNDKKLGLARQILTNGFIGLNELGDILQATFEDGYMDNNEGALLKAITERDVPQSSVVVVDHGTQEITRRILDEKIFSATKFDRFVETEDLQLPIGGSQIISETTAELNSIKPLEGGAYLLSVHLHSEVEDLDLLIETPDFNGTYTLSGNFAGFEDPLESYFRKFIAEEALAKSYQENGPNEEIREAMDTVGRIGKEPGQRGKGPAFACHMAKTSIDIPVTELIQTVTIKAANGDERFIGGMLFKGPLDPETAKKIEQAMTRYPDYLIMALATFKTKVVLFDPSETYSALLDYELLLEPPQRGLSWKYDDDGSSTIFLDAAYADVLIMHELFHTLQISMPGAVHVMPKFTWDYLLPQAGLSRLYTETLQRVKNYEEDAFVTSYQSVSASEYLADGLSVFYGGRGIFAKSSGSVEELMDEDPVQYLLYVQMDSLLERQYSNSAKNECTLPFWAAFTETAIHRANLYLSETGDDWRRPENLKRFRDGSIDMDITREMNFWWALSAARSGGWAPDSPHFKKSLKRLLKAGREALSELPDFNAARAYLKSSASIK